MARKRILFVSNSQGTSAGLGDSAKYYNYPLLVEEKMPDYEFHFYLQSHLSVKKIDLDHCEIIMSHRPDIVILQCGIIEAAKRILPKYFRELFRVVPGGRVITKILHDHRRFWTGILNRLNIHFLEIDKDDFEKHLSKIYQKCAKNEIKLILIEIPLLSKQFEEAVLPDNNNILKEYNEILKEVAGKNKIAVIDPFKTSSDSTRNSLYLKNSVHFTVKGHNLVALNIVEYLKSLE